MRNTHNKNVAELVHYIIVFYMQEFGTCFGDTGILVWYLFSLFSEVEYFDVRLFTLHRFENSFLE